jgi:Bacterial EndoU nuclease
MYERVRRPPPVAQKGPTGPVQRQSPPRSAPLTAEYVPQLHALARISTAPAVRPASGETLQLRKYKDSEIRNEVKNAAKTAQPNRVALLLAIYNEMRFTIDPTPAAFTQINPARTALIDAGRIDAEDADAFDEEATRMQTAGGDPVEATRLRITGQIAARHDAVENAYSQHIFQGDVKDGVPTGYHSKADGSNTHETYGGATNVGNASAGGNQAYQQSVRLQADQTPKPIQSTFFPDAASHDDVVNAIASVYEVGLKTVGYVADTVNGLKLAKRGDTVFPAGGLDTRLAQ